MNRKAIRALSAIPGLYSVVAFLTARRVVVRGRSMLPALAPGERVLFDRLAYALREPCHGNIVLARHPVRPGVLLIKRIAEKDPEGFVLLGDNPDESTDSRQLGSFNREHILARAWIVYWPPERFRRFDPTPGPRNE